MREFGEWRYSPDLRASFSRGELVAKWAKRCPRIFDTLDVDQARNQPQNHFYEWLSAVLMFKSTGYLSLVEKYHFVKHRRKQQVLRRLMEDEVFDWLTQSPRPCQGPDLLSYRPDYSDWFFLEVKGPTDRLRPVQRDYFDEIEQRTGKVVFSVRLKEVGA